MSSKINRLLQEWPPDTVGTLRWLRSRGIDRRLADKYVRSGWLERLGHGAYVRSGASVGWPGAVYALQFQAGLDIHPGGVTAFALRGYAHSVAFGGREVVLFGAPGTRLPAWFVNHPWSQSVSLVTSRAFPDHQDATSRVGVENVGIEVATPERAAFEMMYMVPKRQSYEEALQIMDSLTTLRPHVVQDLLERCTSVKAKRLVLHAAERSAHGWLGRLDLSRVDLGSGRRTIHSGGRLDATYDLVVAEPPRN